MNEHFPRLLVATEFSPNGSGGGAAIVRQMLKGWPVEKLFWWSCLPETNHCFGQKTAAHAVARIPARLYPQQRLRSQKSWLLENVWSPWAVRHFRKTLERLQPDVVWAIPHGWSIPPLARVLPSGPVGFHVSIHDYMDMQGYSARYGRARAKRLAKLADGIYASAVSRDAICHPMVDDLRARTGANGTVAHAGLEAEDFEFLKTGSEPEAGSIRIAYAGSIQVASVFDIFVAALLKIRGQLPRPVTLEFYGDHSHRDRKWFDASWMTEHGNLPAAQLTAALKKCTWGFSPMDLTGDDPRYNRFSLPTKFVSYLAAGLPVITLGHPECSVVKMAAAYHVGVCVTTADVQQIGGQLAGALAEPEPGLKFRAGILRCAAAEFDAAKMRSVLRGCFRKGRGA
jgi:hypothetical protein